MFFLSFVMKLVHNMRMGYTVLVCERNALMERDIRRGSTARRQLAEFVKIFGALLSAFVHARNRDCLFVAHTS